MHGLKANANPGPDDISAHFVKCYLPISTISCLPKVLDALVTDELASALTLQLADQQHVFVKRRSTLTNLLVFNDFLLDALDKHRQDDALYIDMSKAFDKVNHARLLSKVWNFGVRRVLHSLLASYLSGCSQAVRFGDCILPIMYVASDVP
ncbi:hypothetical protein TSAR_010586 [Trichomalopsis sarcophagae]|uniref:Reverse transcriptase domain-containing protein n=1 Tax=Trichomalopsis sarcophagae TaxID=543379 RepID=A0A232ENA9_9HYME|nr:hypothetical protein TSAR_010586 [Trichomalopsis sarcophagae]